MRSSLTRINSGFDAGHFKLIRFGITCKVNLKTKIMSVLKVVEILGNSTESWEDAVRQVVSEASKTIKNIKSVYVQEMQATVKDGKIQEYRVNAKVTFGIMDE